VTTRHPDSTIPQFPNPVIVVIAPAADQCDEYRRLGQELHVAPTVVVSDVQNAATMVAQWRPFAIILDQQWLEFDAEGFKALSRDVGAEEAWRRFGRRAQFLMENDVVALVVACIVTRGTLELPTPPWIAVAAGAVLIVVGIVVKAWANASLEKGSWLWRSFFVRPQGVSPSAVGPYRWLRNPMYTVGYAPGYGLALVVGSLPGLVAAAFAQGTILLMNALVERPHVNGARPPA
jgi:protein-S-isoprenylcysteine O-methyltransferase Ste14